ncbi:GNAT family N-acetyltransferase [Haloquadratum walsbyi]|jgi:Acetyltransferase (GNAT) family.|uniref:Acetyltransferase (GNAT) family n=1 Tax=Haloquadratum walsbyi J07HQW2 TaxID=1238425 RepID=U1PTY8_9EURY|nr:GNAT family N-acetyltransferase [Haloquadratum walsbyi]ERG95846.1 MAG: acetyltransferase (GNAT) family [Haloquadratum walsbyi J07HQW2]
MGDSVQIRSGIQRKDSTDALMRLFDEAVLQITIETVHNRLTESSPGSALVAHDTNQDRVVGACLTVPTGEYDYISSNTGSYPLVAQHCPTEITHIAVTHSQQANGIGSRLVMAALATAPGPIVAQFHQSVCPFYETLGFDIAPVPADTNNRHIDDESDNTESTANILESASTCTADSVSSDISIYYRGTLR